MVPSARRLSGKVQTGLLFMLVLAAAAIGIVLAQVDTPISFAGAPGGGLAAAGDQIWHQDVTDLDGVAEAFDQFGFSVGGGDFNGDGDEDLAIGVPGEDVGAFGGAGSVNVLYGSGSGLVVAGDQIWHQDVADVEGVAEAGDSFGRSVAAGDFNGDGRDDLAIGVFGEAVGALLSAGAVNVLYGSPAGLTAAGDQIWHQDITDVQGVAEAGDSFGFSVAAGDFNGDGRADLAIGVPQESVDAIAGGGAVNVLYGSPTGLTATDNQVWHQDVTDLEGVAETNDRLGWSVAAGDFNRDGEDDLAIGVPDEAVGGDAGARAVNVLYGSAAGLVAAGDQIWHQDIAEVEGIAEPGDAFGRAVAAGDFNGDGADDLAAGVPFEAVGALDDAGSVNVLYGSAAGLVAAGDQIWHQDMPDVEGVAEAGDRFGFSVGAGNFNGDGEDDLAIGVPGEEVEGISAAGAVNVLYGSAGLKAIGDQLWHQNVKAIEGAAEADDSFGVSVAAGDFNGDGEDDLAIGVSGEAIDALALAGAVNVLYGSPPPAPTATRTSTHTPTSTSTPTLTNTPVPGNTATPTPTATSVATATPTIGIIIGDADCSGTVTAVDAALILQFGAGLLDTLPCLDAADVNEDGEVTAVDATLILQFVAGLIGSLPP